MTRSKSGSTVAASLAIEHVAIDDLRPDPANPRRISDAELESLTRSIQEFGLVDPIVARREDGTVVGGHARLLAARRLGHKTVPVVYVDLSVDQARLLNLALNKISGDWDRELLTRLLADLDAAPNVDISLTGFGEDEIAKLLKNLDAREKRDREESFDLDAAWQAAKADTRAQRGDVWRLGDHRVMCGDSTSEADVARLMAGEAGRLLITDPPYGVAYEVDGKNPKFKKRRSAIANDDLGAGQATFWTDAFRHWSLEGDAYVFGPSGPLIFRLAAALTAAGIDPRQLLIWVKDRLVLGRSHYHYRHEHILYGWKGKSSWNGSRKEDSVWEEPRPADSPEHPTIKPLPLCERAIENSSQPNDVVIDAFLGSGTTLIAAERTGRRCFGMEIDPSYVSLVLARWEAFTGLTAEKIE
jgi:DNA modification methylase